MPVADRPGLRRRLLRLTAPVVTIALIGVVPIVTAPAAQAAGQVVPNTVGNVQANQSPSLVGTGTRNFSNSDPAVAVLDSGVESHTDLNLVGSINCMTGSPVAQRVDVPPAQGGSTDDGGHGTSVAGVIAAKDDSKGTVGVAPNAPIWSIHILDANHKQQNGSALCGLQWLVNNAAAHNIKVVNMSLAAPGSDDGNCGRTNGDQVHQLICALTAKGLVFSVSGGNATNGKESGTVNLGTLIPASYDEVLTAVNMSDYDGAPGGRKQPPLHSPDTSQDPRDCTAVQPDDRYYDTADYAVSASDAWHTIAAVGSCAWSTSKGNGYGWAPAGSSISAAVVSGVALQCFRNGQCAGKTGSQAQKIILNQAAVSAANGHSYTGDPNHAVAGKYFGYLASTVPAATSTAGRYTALNPARILDTRTGIGGGVGMVRGGSSIPVQIWGSGGVPTGAASVAVTITIVAPTGSGDVSAYPDGISKPLVSTLNFVRGQTKANQAIVKVGSDGRIRLSVNGNLSGYLVVDVAGWYSGGTVVANGSYVGLGTPTRIADTRTGTGVAKAAVKPGGVLVVQVDGRAGVPAYGPSAVVLNVTAVAPTQTGNLTVYSDNGKSTPVPGTSNLNYVVGQATPNMVVVAPGPGGTIRIANVSRGSVNLVVDISGFVTGGNGYQSGTLRMISPARLLDTRNGTGGVRGAVGAMGLTNVAVAGRGGIPAGTAAGAVLANYTAVSPTVLGNLTAYPAGTSRPNASVLNFAARDVVAGFAMSRIGNPNGAVSLFNNSRGSTNYVMDAFGYYVN
jgi:hypothetical protein